MNAAVGRAVSRPVRSPVRRRFARVAALLTVSVGGLLASSLQAVGASPGQPVADGVDGFRPGYYYESAYAYAAAPAPGFQATLVVGRPGDVKGHKHQHSLGQIAVGQRADRSYLEAGWTQERAHGKPRLFVFWRPASGADTCYNVGCGFHSKGPGMPVGHTLKPGRVLTIAYQHVGDKWWFLVDGKRSGYYPDKLWSGRTFTATDFAQVFGEVYVKQGQRPCADMGNGQLPSSGLATTITATWTDGQATTLTVDTRNDNPGYAISLVAPNEMAYGGPGVC